MPNAPRISSTWADLPVAVLVLICWSPLSNHVSLRLDDTGREAALREDVQRHLWGLARVPLAEEMPDRGRLLEAVSREPAGAPEALDVVDRTEDRLVVGRDLVEAGPRGLDPDGAQARGTPLDHLGHRVENRPVDLRTETRRLPFLAHAEEHPVAFGVEVEGRGEVDGHRVLAHGAHRVRDEYVARIWVNRHVDARYARAIPDDGCGRDPFHELHAQPPARARVSQRDRVRARDAIARAERGAEDVVACHERRELAHLGRLDPAGVVQVVLVPHGYQALEVVGVAFVGQQEQVADVPELRVHACFRLEARQQAHRQLLHRDVGPRRELPPHASGAAAGRLRAQRLPLDERDARAATGEVVGDGAADHAAPDHYSVWRVQNQQLRWIRSTRATVPPIRWLRPGSQAFARTPGFRTSPIWPASTSRSSASRSIRAGRI